MSKAQKTVLGMLCLAICCSIFSTTVGAQSVTYKPFKCPSFWYGSPTAPVTVTWDIPTSYPGSIVVAAFIYAPAGGHYEEILGTGYSGDSVIEIQNAEYVSVDVYDNQTASSGPPTGTIIASTSFSCSKT